MTKRVFITGAAGFIGMHLARRLADSGFIVAGVDNFNSYYNPMLKRARAQEISSVCPVIDLDITNMEALTEVIAMFAPDHVVHLAAQAGVRYSIEHPMSYAHSNLVGHTAVLEACRRLGPKLNKLIYASSSSVYGGSQQTPFSEAQSVDEPVSLYAATKRCNEILSSSYAHLYGMKQVGLRFFTVYGPWGRPDMAYWSFTKSLLEDRSIKVFNQGNMRRDFTYIEDVVSGIESVIRKDVPFCDPARPHAIYNLGNRRSENLLDMVNVIEKTLGISAKLEFENMPLGDMIETYANIDAIERDFGYVPTMTIAAGLPKFIEWYKAQQSSAHWPKDL